MQTLLEKSPKKHVLAASLIATTLLAAPLDNNFITYDDTNKFETRKTYEISTHIDKEKIFSAEYNIIQEELLSYADELISPSPIEMYFARKMLTYLSNQDILAPKIMLDNEREISFYWRNQDNYTEISINEEGLFSYLIDDKIKPIGGEDIAMNELQKLSLFLNLKLLQITSS